MRCGGGGEDSSEGSPDTASASFTIVNRGDATEVVTYLAITRIENGMQAAQPVFTREADLWPDRQITVPVKGGVYRCALDWSCLDCSDDVFDLLLVSGNWVVNVWPGGHQTE